MIRSLIAIAIFLGLLSAIPYLWPDGFSQPPIIMIVLLAIAAGVALVAGQRWRAKDLGTGGP